jgi:hypothetical protein
MKIKGTVLRLSILLAIILFLSSCYYHGFDLLTGTYKLRYTCWENPDNYIFNTITFNSDGTYTMGEDDWLFGNNMYTRTWSQDGDQLSMRSVFQSEFFKQTADFTATLTDSGGDQATEGSGTYNFNYANGVAESGSGNWWISLKSF